MGAFVKTTWGVFVQEIEGFDPPEQGWEFFIHGIIHDHMKLNPNFLSYLGERYIFSWHNEATPQWIGVQISMIGTATAFDVAKLGKSEAAINAFAIWGKIRKLLKEKHGITLPEGRLILSFDHY